MYVLSSSFIHPHVVPKPHDFLYIIVFQIPVLDKPMSLLLTSDYPIQPYQKAKMSLVKHHICFVFFIAEV